MHPPDGSAISLGDGVEVPEGKAGEQPLLLDLSVGADRLMDALTLSPDPLADGRRPRTSSRSTPSWARWLTSTTSWPPALRTGLCEPVFEADADDSAPIGSAFKVYVLGHWWTQSSVATSPGTTTSPSPLP